MALRCTSIVDPVQDDQTHATKHDKEATGQEQDCLQDTQKGMLLNKIHLKLGF